MKNPILLLLLQLWVLILLGRYMLVLELMELIMLIILPLI